MKIMVIIMKIISFILLIKVTFLKYLYLKKIYKKIYIFTLISLLKHRHKFLEIFLWKEGNIHQSYFSLYFILHLKFISIIPLSI